MLQLHIEHLVLLPVWVQLLEMIKLEELAEPLFEAQVAEIERPVFSLAFFGDASLCMSTAP